MSHNGGVRVYFLPALLACFAVTASAQPLVCGASAGSRPMIRALGQAELVGDLLVNCSGVAPGVGASVTVQVQLNAPFTGRTGVGTNPSTEALLLVGDPAPGQQVVQPAGSTVAGANVFQGVLAGPAMIQFSNVQVIPPGMQGATTKVIRITNVRVNARALVGAGNLSPHATMTVSVNAGNIPLPIANATQTVAFRVGAVSSNLRQPDDSAQFTGVYQSCAGNNPRVTAATAPDFLLKYNELFPAAFKERNSATSAANPNTLAAQNVPGQIYNTETGFYAPSFPAANGLNLAGLASQGTRLFARFTGIPAGVNIYVTVQPTAAGSSSGGITARLSTTDADGAGAFAVVAPTIGPYVQIQIVGGSAVASWEVFDPNPTALESLSFGVVVSIPANFTGSGKINAHASLGPVTTAAGTSSSLPSFAAAVGIATAAAINPCTNNVTITTQCPLPEATLNTPYVQTLSATGGATPYTWTIDAGALPPGILLSTAGRIVGTPAKPGGIGFTLRVTDANRGTTTRECSLRVQGPFDVAPSALSFSAASGGPPTPGQNIDISSPVPHILFAVTTAVDTPVNWLRSNVPAGFIPKSATIIADPAGLNPGTYRGTITVTAAGANPPARTVAVTFVVGEAAPPKLAVEPGSLEVDTPRGGDVRRRVAWVLNRGNGSLDFTVTASTLSGGSWLAVTPPSGTVQSGIPFPVLVAISPLRLAPGTYRGKLTFQSSTTGETVEVPVTLSIHSGGDSMLLPRHGLLFAAAAGGQSPPRQRFPIAVEGTTGFDWQISTVVDSGTPTWLTVSPTNGRSQPGLTPFVEVSVNPAGLAAGLYLAELVVRAPNIQNAPRSVFVVLRVRPGTEAIDPVIEPGGLLFVAARGGTNPAPQTILVSNLTSAPVTLDFEIDGETTVFSAAAPDGDQASPGVSSRIEVSADITRLPVGVYRADLTIQVSSDTRVRVADLALIVTPGSGAGASGVRSAEGDCAPTKLVLVSTMIRIGQVAPSGTPVPLRVQVNDDCGAPLEAAGGAVTGSFSSGEAPVILTGLGSGQWEGTWAVRQTTATNVVITFVAADQARKLAGAQEVFTNVDTSSGNPVIAAGGVLSAASFQSGAPVSLGGLISIFGSRLAEGAAAASAFPLPQRLANASVTMGGKALPLIYAGDASGSSQVNAMVPYDLNPDTKQQLVVRRQNSGYSITEVSVAATQPAIFTLPGIRAGQGAILDQRGGVPTTDNPVPRGEFITIYAEGLGPVDGAVNAGEQVTGLFRVTNTVQVGIGGVAVSAADIFFAGLAPGFSGLYQINARVPTSVAAGASVPVIVTVGGQPSNTVIIAVR